jgi:hypothetical protein
MEDEMTFQVLDIKVAKNQKAAQVVVLCSSGSKRISRTIHVPYVKGQRLAFIPNPLLSKEEIRKKHADADAAVRLMQEDFLMHKHHERNMFFLAYESRPWLNPCQGHVHLARTVWLPLAEQASKRADELLSQAREERDKIFRDNPYLVDIPPN